MQLVNKALDKKFSQKFFRFRLVVQGGFDLVGCFFSFGLIWTWIGLAVLEAWLADTKFEAEIKSSAEIFTFKY
jgi:hypothetical protein